MRHCVQKNICSVVLWSFILLLSLSTESQSAPLPFPQRLPGPGLQRDDCAVTSSDGALLPYIQEFLATDTRAGISLYSCVNWEQGFLKSEGVGKKGSRRAAELVARANALKTLLLVNLHSQFTLEAYFTRQTQVKLSIQNVLIKDAALEERPSAPDAPDDVRMMVTIPFYGISGLTSFLLDDEELFLESSSHPPSPERQDVELPEYTGVVIDVSEIQQVQPALLPKILSEDGEIIYQASQVEQNILLESGMIEYVTETSPDITGRAGEHPLVITPLLLASAAEFPCPYPLLTQDEQPRKRRSRSNDLVVEATDAQGQNSVNVVVSVEDAKKLKQLNKDYQLDRQGKYTIVIGSAIGGIKGQHLQPQRTQRHAKTLRNTMETEDIFAIQSMN